MNIFEKIIGELKIKLNFLNRSKSPSNQAKIKDSSGAFVQQVGRDLNIGTDSAEDISNLEKKILNKLYKEYSSDSTIFRWKITDAYKELGIKNGTYVGPLEDSKHIFQDGEYLGITNSGIRYMDSFVRNNKPEIDVTGMSISGGPRGQEITGLKLINNGNASAIKVSCFIGADDIKKVNIGNIERINSNEDSRNSLGFPYSDTPFSQKLLTNLRVSCEYKNKDGFNFTSGRKLSQENRADGNYNISAQLGEYFEI